MRLGKREPKIDPRTLQLKKYLSPELAPTPPRATSWREKLGKMGMLLNDRLGTCGPAGACHQIQAWLNNDGGSYLPTDADVLKAYSALSGYDPSTGKNDNGVYLLEMNEYWRKTGIGGHRVGAYAKLTPKDDGQVIDCCYLFGGVGAGWALPRAWKGQKVWKAPTGSPAGAWQPGSWGGHYAPIVDFDKDYLYVMTWGGITKVEWAAYDLYCDEAYAFFAESWFGEDFKAPNGFDWAALKEDYFEVTGGTAPLPPSPPPPTPPVSPETTIVLRGWGENWRVVSAKTIEWRPPLLGSGKAEPPPQP